MFEFEETVKLTLDRVAGTNNDTCTVFASSSTAAIKGLCLLTEKVADYLGMSKDEVICRLAEYFGVSVDGLLYVNEESTTTQEQ